MKTRELHFGHLGNGVTVYDVNNEKNGDYETVAHIRPNRTVKFYTNKLTTSEKKQILNFASGDNMTISATQSGLALSEK